MIMDNIHCCKWPNIEKPICPSGHIDYFLNQAFHVSPIAFGENNGNKKNKKIGCFCKAIFLFYLKKQPSLALKLISLSKELHVGMGKTMDA